MKFTIELQREKLINLLESFVRNLIGILYQWLTNDGEVLGYILAVSHFVISIFIFIILIVSHTIYPALWLQFVVWLSITLIWLQHVFLKVCISIVAEERLTNNTAPFFDIVKNICELFHISSDRFVDNILVAETVAIICFGLVLIGRLSVYFHKYFSLAY
jgi:hypothetical protein